MVTVLWLIVEMSSRYEFAVTVGPGAVIVYSIVAALPSMAKAPEWSDAIVNAVAANMDLMMCPFPMGKKSSLSR